MSYSERGPSEARVRVACTNGLLYEMSDEGDHSLYILEGTRAVLQHILNWPKSSFSFLHNILLFGQPNICTSELYHTRPMDVRDTSWEGGSNGDDQSQVDKDLVQEDSAHTDDQGNLPAG